MMKIVGFDYKGLVVTYSCDICDWFLPFAKDSECLGWARQIRPSTTSPRN